MSIEGLLMYFQTHKGSIKRSALEISRRTKSTKSQVIKAKQLFRSNKLQEVHKRRLPKILIFDIETAPVKAFIWKIWKENISLDQIISDWFVICWSAKWLYSNKVMGECLTPDEIINENDERIVKSLWKLFDEADIIIAHNAINFDQPKMNARFIQYDLNPPSPYRVIDTLQVAKKQFKFTSNKLDALATFFGFRNKLNTDFNLWKDCLQGKQQALSYMFKYNKYDVELLEAVYLKLLPWIHNHPNIANYINSTKPVCCNCGSDNLHIIKDRYYKTQIGTYNVYRCEDCGAISRGRTNIGNKTLTTSLAR